ncbi:MAG: MFS transporter [Deltaproteobacteria bacterium]|nr:MFS transporter [Deltaproteobacteria bacterium]
MSKKIENIPLLRAKEKFGYSLGDFASNLFWMTFIFYGMFFYTDVFGLPAAMVGTMFGLTKLWDAVNDPMMGIISDRTDTKMGKYRPYLLWMFVPFGIIGFFAFYTPDMTVTGKLVYAYITYTLMMMVYTAINIPYSALMGVLTPSSKDRTSISSYRFVAAFAGGIVVQMITVPMVSATGANSTNVINLEQVNPQEIVIKETGVGTIQLQANYESVLPTPKTWQQELSARFTSVVTDDQHKQHTANIWVNVPERLNEIKPDGWKDKVVADNQMLGGNFYLEKGFGEKKIDLIALFNPAMVVLEPPAVIGSTEKKESLKDVLKKDAGLSDDDITKIVDNFGGAPEVRKDDLTALFASLKAKDAAKWSKAEEIALSARFEKQPPEEIIKKETDWKSAPVLNVVDQQTGFEFTIGLYALLAMGFFFVTFLTTKERVKPSKDAKSSVGKDLVDVVSNLPWWIVGVMGLFSIAQVCIRNGVVMYYFKYYVKDIEASVPFMLAGTVMNLIGVLATDWLTRKLGSKKIVYAFCSFFTVATMMPFMWLSSESLLVMFALTAIGGFLSGPLSPIVWAMYADIADYSEWKKGTRATGLFFSAATFAQKMGWTLGGMLAGLLLSWYGFQANMEQSAEAISGIKSLMSWIPSIGCAIAGAVVLLYTLDDKTMDKIVTELEERRAKEKENENNDADATPAEA